MQKLPRLAYLIDPSCPGDKAEIVASELRLACKVARVTVHAIAGASALDSATAPALAVALHELGLTLDRNSPTIGADLVILHDLATLHRKDQFNRRIVTRHLIAVAHEDFLRPTGQQPFDVSACLALVDNGSLALRKTIAPVSPANRQTVLNWAGQSGRHLDWTLSPTDWFPICDFQFRPATRAPQDRRGRISHPGFEKFPDLAAMDHCFPRDALANLILGADNFLDAQLQRPHWQMLRAGGLSAEDFFSQIDFLIHFTAPTWRDGFVMEVAQAIAAGKVVLTDPQTASAYGGTVIGTNPAGVDALIGPLLASPELYQAQVAAAQAALKRFGPAEFSAMLARTLEQLPGGGA